MSDIRYFGHYDENGNYKAFFPTDVYPDTGSISTPNIELSYDDWQEALSKRCRVIDGVHTVVPYTAEEEAEFELNNIRRERDDLLGNSDWIVLPYSPITGSKLDEWVQYRQDLRDVTLQTPPYILPTKPE
jgi:hypothetical protein